MKAEEQVRLHHLIRDTTGLTANEKAFCRLIVDRSGILYATWKQNALDMGVGKDAYYRARDGVLAKGVVMERRGYKTTTAYTLVTDVLGGHVPSPPRSGKPERDENVSTSSHSGKPEAKAGCISTTNRETIQLAPGPSPAAEEPRPQKAAAAESGAVPRIVPVFEKPSRYAPDPATWAVDDEGVLVCDDHPQRAMPCEVCASRQRLVDQAESKPEWQRIQWHQAENEAEGLAPDGDGPPMTSETSRCRSRRRS